MKKPVVDYRTFRLSRINEPQFSHLKLLSGWIVYFVLFVLTENLIPAESCTPMHCWLDDIIPFCEAFVIPYVGWYLLIIGSLGYFLLYDIDSFKSLQKYIFLTHAHFDHIYGLNDLFNYNPYIRIYTCEEGKKGLYSDKLNLSKYHNKPFFYRGENISLLNGSSKDLWPNVKCRIYKTPGHDWSCLIYEIEDYLFTGDSYIPGEEVVTSFPKSNKIEATESVEKISQILQVKHNICPGHGDILFY